MAKSRPGRRTPDKSRAAEGLEDLRTMFAFYPNAIIPRPPDERATQISDLIEFICAQLIDVIGTSGDYDMSFPHPDPIDGQLFPKRIQLIPKAESNLPIAQNEGFARLVHILNTIPQAIISRMLTIDEAATTFDGISDHLKRKCKVTIRWINNNPIRLKNDESYLNHNSISDPVAGVSDVYPSGVTYSLSVLRGVCINYIIDRTRQEIAGRDLHEQVTEIERREADSMFHSDYYAEAMKSLLRELEEEVARRKKQKKTYNAITINDSHANGTVVKREPEGSPARGIRTRRRDIPAERIGLFFYYLFEVTRSTGTREDKAKVVGHLTQFSESTIKRLLSNPLANEDKDRFNENFNAVMAMFRKIGFSQAYEQMKNDKKSK